MLTPLPPATLSPTTKHRLLPLLLGLLLLGAAKAVLAQSAPVFNPRYYDFYLAETQTVGVGLDSVTATDADGDSVNYAIMAGGITRALAWIPPAVLR